MHILGVKMNVVNVGKFLDGKRPSSIIKGFIKVWEIQRKDMMKKTKILKKTEGNLKIGKSNVLFAVFTLTILSCIKIT